MPGVCQETPIALRRALGWSAAALVSAACSSAPPAGPVAEMTGESADAVTDWSLFPTGDECLVAIQAFYKAKFGVSVPVARNAWTGGCGPTGACHIWVDDIPNSATWERIANDGSHTPAPYDMIVYPPIPGDVYGHIASVDHVQGTSIYVMDDNYCNNDCQRKAPAPHTVSWKAYGWYHLRSLPGGGSSGGGGSCPSGDGLYCGGNGVSGDPGTLYACGGGKLATSQVCPHGCQKMSAGTNDQCAAAPSGPSPASCPSGDGLYCGGNGVSGDASTLYQCTGGNLTVAQSCSNGCQKMPAGTNDQCAAPPPPPPSCPSGNGLYCGNDGVGGDSNTLYQCTGGSLSPVSLCAQGCTTMPAGTNDQCASSSCPSGDGLYCGGDTIIGSTSTLYRCAAGVLTVAQACANGCAAMAAGTNDACR